jgi:hypothetical protein
MRNPSPPRAKWARPTDGHPRDGTRKEKGPLGFVGLSKTSVVERRLQRRPIPSQAISAKISPRGQRP